MAKIITRLGYQDLTGQKFGKLKVLNKLPPQTTKTHHGSYWLCSCECGNIIEVRSDSLKGGQKACRSCYTHDVEKPGDRFGRLTVIERAPKRPDLKSRDSRWICECACGNIVEVSATSLKAGHTKSCGCYGKEVSAKQGKASATHGMRHTPEYHAWCGMRSRCYNENDKSFYSYGARGIVVCDRWLESFENFFEDMGSRPDHHSLDRIDNNGPYSPENCKWSTRDQQNNNKSNNRMISFKGETLTLSQWAKKIGITLAALSRRLEKGCPLEDALSPKYLGPSYYKKLKIITESR